MEREPDKEAYALSPEQRREIYEQRIAPTKFADIEPAEAPVAYLVGGQPGSGKTRFQNQIRTSLRDVGEESSVMEIIGDDFRPYHPAYRQLLRHDDERAAFFTDLDSGQWVEMAIADSLDRHPHVILEGTLRRAEITTNTAARYQAAGFRTELYVVAVHEYFSRLYTVGRYLRQLRSTGFGRYTLRSAHDTAYQAVPDSVQQAAASGHLDRVVLFSHQGDTVLDTHDPPARSHDLRSALLDERRRQAEELDRSGFLAGLDTYLTQAERFDRRLCREDLVALRADVEG